MTSIAKEPSKLSLPRVNPGVKTVLEYLILKFPSISAELWRQRIQQGKIHWHDRSLITAESAFKAQQRVYYYREVECEPLIPLEESILFEDELLLVAYKPHFLPVTAGGAYINECLQNRLRDKTGIATLQALHRLDRATAGLVLFSKNQNMRQPYHHLFATQQMHKTYQAIACVTQSKHQQIPFVGQHWEIKNRLIRAEPKFTMRIAPEQANNPANSHSIIRCIQRSADKALFELNPITGKTHQLRLHMQALGWPILNDKYYPTLQQKSSDDYDKPLQLLAQQLKFIDPVNHQQRIFNSNTKLSLEEDQKDKK
ncbi:MAG: pseudouridine synthase [Spongiibacteraceae bacterium]